ncbi:SDR family NAD(P)-dependent oxidoreductase [Bdellovibrio svalbardensis]|uniref:SDR family oxidoreductase n=1 Tax=Bdellovibrio svalbardensis TaxID=2972972 RepID=A0ABT6DM85_9BACT|nr:SDR family NAD(P)-dependent oxidoreductase [Bdellovibrio svalbardensis]MDG0817024.1 SDR family oxidoreductase [Bdellovibrio svalbardensis]
MNRFQNKTAFITGGNSGIGKESALIIAKEGANIMIADIKENKDVLKELESLGVKAAFIACDVSDPMAVKEAVTATVKTFGSLDVAFNNAGVGDEGFIHEKTFEQWKKVIDINLSGVFYCMKYEIEQMLQQKNGGNIINVSSILGQVGTPGASAYVAAKHGVVGLTQTAAAEYGAKNIRVNAIGPGYIETPLLHSMSREQKYALEQMHPMKRLGRPEEVAKAFLWLASDDSSFMTGDYIPVDGGYLAQ